ncbi:MAG: type II secretion system F family protein, partial [Pseudomonadota bacterium]
MFEAIVNAVTDRSFQVAVLVSMAAIATAYTVLEPFLVKDKLKERMRSVATHRDALRSQQREALARKGATARLRNSSPEGVIKELVENLKLLEVFDSDAARKKLMMAGYRGQGPVFTFMAARLGLPFVLALFIGIYVYALNGFGLDNFGKLLATIAAFLSGFYVPNLYVNNAVKKRQQKVQVAWPDALDLLLICVESGMSIEAAFQKVADEVGPNCPELAEELGLTNAELSYLQDRKQAFVNLAERTGLEAVKAVVTALVQSEKYGTPLGQSLR